MKKILSVILCVCLLGCAAAFAEEEDELNEHSFLLKVRDRSGLEITYLRLDFYAGDEYRGMVCSCPDEGEDFYRCPAAFETAEDREGVRIEVLYGISDLAPEDAILEVMKGNPAEEHALTVIDPLPEGGAEYSLDLVPDGEGGWQLVPAEAA